MSIKKKFPETIISLDVTTETENTSHILNKLDILVLNNGWNDKNEKLIVGIGYNCGIYKQLHEQSSKYYKKLDKGISLSLLILSVFLTTDSIINLLKGDIFIIIQKVIIFILAIISIINNFLKYDELSQQHLYAANSFNIIYNDVRNMMCIYKKDRINAIRYMQQTIKEYDHLEISSPEITERFIKKMENKIKTDDKYKDISMPINQFRKIEVIIDKMDNNDNNNDNDIQMNTFNTQNIDNKESVLHDKTSNKFIINNMQNIEQIHECFKIDGELSENDNITIADVEHYKRNGIELQTQYEFNRFMRH
jgi:hypothetical protein